MGGNLVVPGNIMALEEDRMIAEKFERSILKSSVTIGVVAEMFATEPWQSQDVGNVLWTWNESNMKGSFDLPWFLSKLPIPEIPVDMILI